MSLNTTFDGFTFNENLSPGNSDIYYQGYFYKGSTSSSLSKWNSVRLVESTGYYNINLGSADWLGQDGTALSEAKVVIVFWSGNIDRLSDCSLLSSWGALEVTLDGSSFYSQNAQIKSNILPDLNWSTNIPTHSYVDTSYYVTNSSDDIHSWEFDDVIMYHWYTRYNEVIFNVNIIDSTNYIWGDGEETLDLSGASNASHQWTAAGTYTMEIEVVDACLDSVSDSKTIDVYWHQPAPNIVRCDAAGNILSNTVFTPDTEVFFKYSGTDIDSTITSIEWTINDSGAYGNTDTYIVKSDSGAIVAHTEGEGTSWLNHMATPGAFTNPSTHNVAIVVNWFDGFENQSVTYNENFTQNRFDQAPQPNIICNEAVSNHVITPSTIISFDYTGSNPSNRITSIDWLINDSGIYGNTDTTDSVLYGNTVYHSNGEGASWYGNETTLGAFTNPGNHSIDLVIHWNDGWDNKITTYSETVIQDRFSGPNVSFFQEGNAEIGGSVLFNNVSTATDRVGLGLPDDKEYTWYWLDNSVQSVESDKPLSYVLSKIPSSVDCTVELCADWSDGWVTQTSCYSKSVVFDTTITVEPEDCYYSLSIIGTSSNGSVSAYDWLVQYGDTETGPWTTVWESPSNIDQQEKTLCFSKAGWYRIEGFVRGSGLALPTSDDEILFINEVCSESSSIYNVWNGTGPLDIGVDWIHSGLGIESLISKYKGTNGLEVSEVSSIKTILFSKTADLDVNDYDFLSFWINIKSWQKGKDIYIKLFSTNYSGGTFVKLSNFIGTVHFNEWERIMIPLSKFNLKHQEAEVGWPTYVNNLSLELTGDILIWLDNISLTMGTIVTVPVCAPDLKTSDEGGKHMRVGTGFSPQMTVTTKAINVFPKPINL